MKAVKTKILIGLVVILVLIGSMRITFFKKDRQLYY